MHIKKAFWKASIFKLTVIFLLGYTDFKFNFKSVLIFIGQLTIFKNIELSPIFVFIEPFLFLEVT